MAARSTMADLIALVRVIVNDTSSVVFTDDEIEDYLDMEVKAHLSHYPMSKNHEETIYYSAPYKLLEDTVTIYNGSGANSAEVSSGDYTADLIKGTFTFSSDQNSDYYISGQSYNIDRAIARCFEQLSNDPAKTRGWAASGGVGLTHNDLLLRARHYRAVGGAKPTGIRRAYGS